MGVTCAYFMQPMERNHTVVFISLLHSTATFCHWIEGGAASSEQKQLFFSHGIQVLLWHQHALHVLMRHQQNKNCVFWSLLTVQCFAISWLEFAYIDGHACRSWEKKVTKHWIFSSCTFNKLSVVRGHTQKILDRSLHLIQRFYFDFWSMGMW